MKRGLARLARKKRRLIVGIETGNTPGRMGGAVVGVSGSGDETVLEFHGFIGYELPAELIATLAAVRRGGGFDSEELAGINFLFHHHLSALYEELLEELGIPPESVDLIGLKCLEIGDTCFPDDPSVLSEMTDCIVASRFSIGIENATGNQLQVSEPLLRTMVGSMVDRFELESEAREAVAVALLANEALFHEETETCLRDHPESAGKVRSSLKTVKRTATIGREGACLCGEFFFPS